MYRTHLLILKKINMTIREQILNDIKEAMKAKEVEKRDVLRTLDSMIKNEEIATGKREEGLGDDGVIVLVKRAIKQRKDSAEQFRSGNRDELAQKEEREIDFIEKYLPVQMSESDVRDIVEKIVDEVGATSKSDMGKVMGSAMGAVGDAAEGSVVRKIVEELLSE